MSALSFFDFNSLPIDRPPREHPDDGHDRQSSFHTNEMIKRRSTSQEQRVGEVIVSGASPESSEKKHETKRGAKRLILMLPFYVSIAAVVWLFISIPGSSNTPATELRLKTEKERRSEEQDAVSDEANKNSSRSICPYQSLDDLMELERYPKASGQRHIVDPPAGGKVTLVCCQTTVGPWSILIHHKWAPLGAKRFLDMVTSNYFSNKVPLMRCVHNFLCQFGLAGPASHQFRKSINDDPNWLPEGPKHRQNEQGVKRFQAGYLAYAGAGPRTRSIQLIVALKDNGPLGGGSPWEVPWGELVGKHSFETLSKLYTGYGENGPSQAKLSREGALEMVARDFPKLDHILSCQVVDEEVQSER